MKKSLSTQEVQTYKKRLLDMRAAISESIERVEAQSLPSGGARIETGDGATEESSLENELAGLAVSDQIDDSARRALDRVREGVYGTCATCGTEIGRERLDLLPYAVECVRCAQRRGQNGFDLPLAGENWD